MAPDDLAGARVDEAQAVFVHRDFVAKCDFEAGTRRNHVGHIHDVGVAEAEVPEHFPIGLQRDGTQNDFIATVAIYIGGEQRVAALSANLRCLLVAIPAPEFFEFTVLKIVGVDDHTCVGAAAHEETRVFPVEISEADLVSIDAIAGLIAPIARVAALHPIGAGYFLPGQAVQDSAILWAGDDEAARAAFFFGQRLLARGGVGRALESDLGSAIASEIPHDDRRPPDPHVHVPAEVVPPKEGAVVQVGLELVRVGAEVRRARIEAGARLLDDVVELPVAVEIGEGYFLKRGILVLELDREKRLHRRFRGQFDARHNGTLDRLTAARERDRSDPPRIGQVEFRGGVDVVGAGGHRRVVKFHGLAARSGAVDVEHAPCRIALEEPPAEIDRSFARAQRNHRAVEFFGGEGRRGSRREQRDGNEKAKWFHKVISVGAGIIAIDAESNPPASEARPDSPIPPPAWSRLPASHRSLEIPPAAPQAAHCITPVRRSGTTAPLAARRSSRRNQSSAAFTVRTFTVSRGPG